MGMSGFICHDDYLLKTAKLTDAEVGRMFRALMRYHATGEVEEIQGLESIAFDFIREEDILRWRDYNGLRFLQCACRFTENNVACDAEGRAESKRLEIKNLIAQLKKINPSVEANIFRSVENVNLSTVICYKKDGIRHSFLETYAEETEKRG